MSTIQPATLGNGLHVVEAGPFLVSIADHDAGHALAPYSHASATATVLLAGDYFEECATLRQQLVPLTGVLKPAHESHTNHIGRRGARSLVVETHHGDWTPLFERPAVLENPELITPLLAASREIAAEHPSAIVIESLIAEWLGGVDRTRREVITPAWLQRAREIIHATSTEDLRLASIASEVDLHPMYVARAFRKAFGRSIGEYAVALRLARAARQLAEGTDHVGRVALKAGYYDHSHMTRDFRARTGMSPTDWRRIAAA